ncbi:MAG: two-CW domain-containing protein [Candidatus Methylomirabilia bacterium]
MTLSADKAHCSTGGAREVHVIASAKRCKILLMKKLNCWEVQNCGREPGGHAVGKDGPCPAAVESTLHGVHGGQNSGRTCWVLAGTFCSGQVMGTVAKKLANCSECQFYQLVLREEGENIVPTLSLVRRLNCAGQLD